MFGIVPLGGVAFAQAPVITTRPLTKIAGVGAPVSFTVAASSGQPVTYVWKRNGQTIAGATTATLAIPSATLLDRGWYQVLVSNATATAASTFSLQVATVPIDRGTLIGWGWVEYNTPAALPGVTDLVAFAAGAGHVLGLRMDGTIAAAGANYSGQVTVPAGLTQVVAVAAGGEHSLALRADGSVVAWGNNGNGQSSVPSDLTDVVAVSAGITTSFALKSDGSVVAWGLVPVPSGLAGLTGLDAGDSFALGRKADGTVVAWGQNGWGQLAIPSGLANVTAVAAGDVHSLALTAGGTVVAWGSNAFDKATPPAGLAGVVAIAAGTSHSIALKSDGTIVVWGGAMPLGTTQVPPGLNGVAAIDAGNENSWAMVSASLPTIVTQPVAVSVNAGAPASLSVTATGPGSLSYVWQRNGVNLSDGVFLTGTRTAVLQISNAQAAAAGSYTVVVTGPTGSVVSQPAALTVNVPANITLQPSTQTVFSGTTLNLHVTATSALPITYVWKRNGSILVDGNGISGATSPNLSVANVQFSHEGSYWVELVTSGGTVLSDVVTITIRPANDDFASAQVLAGATGAVAGGNPNATGQPGEPAHSLDITGTTTSSVWYRWTPAQSGTGVVETSGANFVEVLAVYTGSALNGLTRLGQSEGFPGLGGARVTFAATAGTTYWIAVASKYDNRGTFNLLWHLEVLPTISVQPTTQVAVAGGSATFTVTADGSSLMYQWFRDGHVIVGATTATLTRSNVQLADAGAYQVKITNLQGSVLSSVVKLTGANSEPVISVQPQSLSVVAGQPATFSVTASGAGPLTYRWRRNGVVLAGATASSFTLPATVRADANTYDVQVFDGLSLTISQRAVLTVAPTVYPGIVINPVKSNWVPELDAADPVAGIVPDGSGKCYVFGPFRVMAGRWRSGIARLNADGSFDATFVPPAITGQIYAVVPAGGGKIWVAGALDTIDGSSYGPVIRLNSDGSRDGTYSLWESELTGMAEILVPLSDGRLLLAGGLAVGPLSYNFVIVAANGRSFTPLALSAVSGVGAMLVQPDGKILVGGGSGYNGVVSTGTGIARLNADATLDPSFHPPIVAGESEGVAAIALQPDGKILIGGSLDGFNTAGGRRVKRLLPDGTLDATFGGMNKFYAHSNVNTLAVQSDGKILVGGSGDLALIGSGYQAAVRLNADGTLDSTFAPAPNNEVASIVLQSGACWMAGRFTTIGGGSQPSLARLSLAGVLDSSFTLAPRQVGTIASLTHSPDGGIYVTGRFAYLGGVPTTGIARIDAAGAVSPQFLATGYGGTVARAFPQADGRVVAISYAGVVRHLPNGARDSSYPGLAYAGDQFPAAAVLPGDRLALNATSVLNVDGTVDPTFDAAGRPIDGGGVYALAGLPDGKLLVGGSFTQYRGQAAGRIVRLNIDGSVDATFGTGTGFDDQVNALAVQPDGKIVVAGAFGSFNGIERKRLARLNANGTLDPTFGSVGLTSPVSGLVLQENGAVIEFGALGGVENLMFTGFAARASASGTIDPLFGLDLVNAPLTSMLVTGSGRVYGGTIDRALVDFQPTSGPTINSQPVAQVRAAGDTATFSVSATGSPPLYYQWRLNGQDLPGASTATLTLTNVNVANAGLYSVLVGNSYGTIVSGAVLLSGPNPLPIIVGQPQAQNKTAGTNVTFAVSATGVGTLGYQWRLNGRAIAGATAATLDLGPASLIHNDSLFDVVVNDGLSTTISQSASVRVTPSAYPGAISPDPAFHPGFEVAGGLFQKFFRAADGRVYVAGLFSRLSGLQTWNLARLSSGGSIDTSFVAATTDSPIQAIEVQPDGKVIIGGLFRRIDGKSVASVARLNSDGSLDPSFRPAVELVDVYALRVQPDGKILVGGGFTAGSGLVRLQADGTLDDSFVNTSLSGFFYDLALQPDGKIIAGGSFHPVAGSTYQYLARLNASGSIDPTFNPGGAGPSLPVKAIRLLSDGRMLVGGYFYTYNGVGASKIVRLTAAGAVDPTWSIGEGFTTFTSFQGVEGLEVQADGRVLVFGIFYRFNGTSVPLLPRLTTNGTLDPTFLPPSFSSNVNAACLLANGNILVGGAFSEKVDVLSSAGTPIANTLKNTLFFPVLTLIQPATGGKFYAAGNFTHVNGVPQNGLARLNADGTTDTAFNPGSGPSNSIWSMMVQSDGKVVIVGAFDRYNGISRPYLARINTNGTLDGTFQSDASELFFQDIEQIFPLRTGRMLVLGSSHANQPTFVRLNADGGIESVFLAPGGGALSRVTQVAEQSDGRMIMVGSFNTTQGWIVRVQPNGDTNGTFAAAPDGPINAMALQTDGKILIAGDFLTINNAPASRVARLNSDGSRDVTFDAGSGPDGSVQTILLQSDGRVLLGGRFTGVNGVPNQSFLTRLQSSGALDPTFGASRFNGSPSQMRMQDDGSLLLSGGFNEQGSYQQYGVLRSVSQLPVVVAPPASQMAYTGGEVSFTITASGAVSYQWRRNDVDIPGATTATLALPAVQTADAGSYSVLVTNGTGSVIAGPVTLTVATPPAPQITLQPVSRVASPGDNVTFTVGASSVVPPSYQWWKGTAPIPGATAASLVRSNVQAEDAGAYSVVVSNAGGSSTSGRANLSIVPPGVLAAHWVEDYTSDGVLRLTGTLTYPNAVAGLKWSMLLPAGWVFGASPDDLADTRPAVGASGLAEWTWSVAPPSPFTLHFTLNVAGNATAAQEGAAMVSFSQSGANVQLMAQPDPIVLGVHSADTNGDGRIALLELTRVIELYNTRNGTSRTGAYDVSPAPTEDGFMPAPSRAPTGVITPSRHHSADTSPADGRISLLELTRMIELYNFRNGTTRTGQYHIQKNTEDGFGAGPAIAP